MILESNTCQELAEKVTAEMNNKIMKLPCGNMYCIDGIYYQPMADFNDEHIAKVLFLFLQDIMIKC